MSAKKYHFSEQSKKELWQRWRSGQSCSEIARALEATPASVHIRLVHTGGITPVSRKRDQTHLNLQERKFIQKGLENKWSLNHIASILDRSPSTISREIKRNSLDSVYNAEQADNLAWDKGLRPKQCKLALNPKLRDFVAKKLALNWSPEQISGRLKKIKDKGCKVSYETIYKSLYIQTRGVLKKELIQHLRARHRMRQARSKSTEEPGITSIKNLISISERPAVAEDRAVPGHWEGDLICGSKNSHIATLVERRSRFTLLVQLEGKDAISVMNGLTREMNKLPKHLMQTLTWDRGGEMAAHQKIALATDCKIYFCDPSSPWQRGTNENTNRLLRQYFPKKTDLKGFSQEDLDQVALQLNERPRKTLDYQTPLEVFSKTIAMTG